MAAESKALTPKEDERKIEVVVSGDKLVIPEGMSLESALVWIKRKIAADEKAVNVREVIDAYPFEGARAFKMALDKVFNYSNMIDIPGLFGDRPPIFLNIEVAPGVTEAVGWGRYVVPAIDGWLQTSIAYQEGLYVFCVTGEIKQAHRPMFEKLMVEARKIVREFSIYKGKAFYLTFPDPGTDFNPEDYPRFIPAHTYDASSLVLPKITADVFEASVVAPITKTADFRALGIPLKTGILLEGPPGVGKTLAAHVTARYAVDNGWTFIYLKKPSDLPNALRFARKYYPAVIFLEDIDRVLSGERDTDVDEILNTLDGIDSKSSETMVVVTTNHIEKMQRVALRPGRFDAVISVRHPDAGAAEVLVRKYAGMTLSVNEDIRDVCGQMAKLSLTPAVICEVVKKAKRSAVFRATKPITSVHDVNLTQADFQVALDLMRGHVELLKETGTTETRDERLVRELGKGIGASMLNAGIGMTPVKTTYPSEPAEA